MFLKKLRDDKNAFPVEDPGKRSGHWSEGFILEVYSCKDLTENNYAPIIWSYAVSYMRFGTTVNGDGLNLSSESVGVGFNFEADRNKDF